MLRRPVELAVISGHYGNVFRDLTGRTLKRALVQLQRALVQVRFNRHNADKPHWSPAASDRQIDARNNALFRETLAYMREKKQSIAACTQILFCVKNLKRAGDHATNIAESVHYTITGHLPAGQRPKENVADFAKLSA